MLAFDTLSLTATDISISELLDVNTEQVIIIKGWREIRTH